MKTHAALTNILEFLGKFTIWLTNKDIVRWKARNDENYFAPKIVIGLDGHGCPFVYLELIWYDLIRKQLKAFDQSTRKSDLKSYQKHVRTVSTKYINVNIYILK